MEFLKSYRFFLFRSILFIVFSIILILFTDKNSLHLSLNKYHSLFFDTFFKFITHLGDGIFLIILSLILLFLSIRTSLAMIIAGLLSLPIVQFLKHFIFKDYMRPVKCIDNIEALHLVKDVKILTHHSFPSGHAATAFIIGIVLCMSLTKKEQQKWLYLGALIIAYSRVYLSLHFLEDIVFGTSIGIITGLTGIIIAQKIPLKGYEKINIPKIIANKR